MRAYSPTGSLILGTLDVLTARAEISEDSWSRVDGKLDFEYAGETEMFYDEQKTVECDGKAVFLDENGEEWTEDQIELRDDE